MRFAGGLAPDGTRRVAGVVEVSMDEPCAPLAMVNSYVIHTVSNGTTIVGNNVFLIKTTIRRPDLIWK